MKKVLFLSPLPPPYYGSAMSSKMCLGILKESKNFKVKNIKLNYSKDMNDIGKISLDKIRGIFHVKNKINKTIKEFKPDIIYFVPATYSLGLIRDWQFVREIKKYWKGKIIFHIRSRILEKTWNNHLKRKILKDMYIGNKAIILGKELIKDLREMIQEEDISILPNAIRNEITESRLKKINIKRKRNKQFNMLFLSNMDRTKGWTKLLDACKILKDKEFNFKCDFVGEWLSKKDEDYFWNFVKKNKLKEKVFAHGKKFGNEKNSFLEEANVLVFPTEMDTFGKVLIEAYMFGVPVIANKEGAIQSIIDNGETGILLRKNTGSEIAKIILNSKEWERMGINGRKKFLEKFEIIRYKEKFLKIISS